MAEFNPDDTSRFDNFIVLTTPYKTVRGHPITLNILYPKTLTKAPPNGSPIIIRFHGGGLFAGSSMFRDFFARWILELAERHGAIIISPDYRLLPEAYVSDILNDVEDAWTWIQSSLTPYLQQQTNGSIIPDLTRILTASESAGGYLSLVLSLNHAPEIRGTTAQYPMADLKAPHSTEKYEKQLFDIPQLRISVMTSHVAKITSGEAPAVVSSDPRLARAPLMFIAVQQGLFPDYLDFDNVQLYPLQKLANGEGFPRGGVFICHGKQDSLVPAEQSEKVEAVVKEKDPGLYFRLARREGEHGFDADARIDDGWMAKGLGPVVRGWLE